MDLRHEIAREIKELRKTMSLEEILKAVIDLEKKATLACGQGERVTGP